MNINRLAKLLIVLVAAVLASPASATNTAIIPTLSDSEIAFYLSSPSNPAAVARYDIKDNVGNAMQSPSIIQMSGQAHRYAAVYHTPYPVAGGYRYRVNLAVSDDLMNWSYVGMLIDNADMPKIGLVTGSSWVVVTHEQWQGSATASSAPARVGYKLFYDFNDLLNLTIRATWTAPQFVSTLNGTPSIYEFHLAKYGNYYSVDGQYGFHYWNGTRDANGVTTITRLFDPTGGTVTSPSVATAYNNAFIANGVSGNIGQRDTLITTSSRYNIQEGNTGQPGASWDRWRLWLYKFGDGLNYPTGNGTVSAISPATPGGSTSFGNPSITVLDAPDGPGKVIVVSYFLFTEGAAPGEAGSLLYYFHIN